MARKAAIAALVLGAVAVVLLVTNTSHPTFTTEVPAATNLVGGTRVTDGAKNVGSVTDIEPLDGGRRARLTISISDDASWPLRSDARLEVRYGGTASFSNRYLLLRRGTSGSSLSDGGTLPAANVEIPVELDQLINELTPPVRTGIRDVIVNSANTLERASGDINDVLGKTPELSRHLSLVFQDVVQDRAALRTLVQSTQRTVAAVDRANPGLRTLLDGAAATFDAIADESDDLQVALDRFPAALRQTRETLSNAGGTLTNFAELSEDLAPGVRELRATATPLVRTLQTLRSVTPAALAALAPQYQEDIRIGGDVLRTAGNVTPRLSSLFKQAATELGCVRPWAPEIVLLGETWGDWISPVDDRDHLLRATLQNYLPASYNNVPFTPGEAAKLYSGMEYGFPRPPGALAKQPWFQPQCGVGPDAVDPSKDVEGQTFRENMLPPELEP